MIWFCTLFFLGSPFQKSGTLLIGQCWQDIDLVNADKTLTFTRPSVCSQKGVSHLHNQACILDNFKSDSQSLKKTPLLLHTPNLQEGLGRKMVMLYTRLQHCSAVLLLEVPFRGSFAFSITRLWHTSQQSRKYSWIFSCHLSYCLFFWIQLTFIQDLWEKENYLFLVENELQNAQMPE